MSIYRETLGTAWRMAWRRKALWVFGLFAALVGTGGAWNTFFKNLSYITDQSHRANEVREVFTSGTIGVILNNISGFFGTPTPEKLLTLLIVAAIFLAFFWIALVSVGALISFVGRTVRKEPVTFHTAYSAGVHYFPRIFALNVLGWLSVAVLLAVVGLPFAALFLTAGAEVWSLLFGVVAFIALVPIAVIVTFIIQYASAFVILNDRTTWAAIGDAWRLFRANWLASLEMAFILYLIDVLVGFFLFTLFLAPLLQLVLTYVGGTYALIGPILQLSIFFTFAVLAALSAILATFEFSAYTIFFLRLTEGKVISKIARIFNRFVPTVSQPTKSRAK